MKRLRLMLILLGLSIVSGIMAAPVIGQQIEVLPVKGAQDFLIAPSNYSAAQSEKPSPPKKAVSPAKTPNLNRVTDNDKPSTNSNVNGNLEDTLRQLTQEFMTLRQQRRGEQLRRFYAVDDVAKIHDFLIYQYTSIKVDMKKGSFTPQYVRRSIEESDFVDVYKEAFLNYLFKDRDLNQELDQAFTRFLGSYKYTIPRFQINKIRPETNKKTVYVDIVEYRLTKGEKEAQPQNRTLQWYFKDGKWYLTTDKPANY
jgi:hypothetical protein